jgi:APA family basic amino acid/polyamine antiporter
MVRLVRGIRRWDLVGLFINAIVGAGIFGLPATVYRLTGVYSILAYVVCAVPVVLIVLCFAELASRFKDTGGPYLYVREAFGPAAGFQVGWLLWLARLTAFAALCNLWADYLGYFAPSAMDGLGRTAVIAAVVGTFAAVNLIGVRPAVLVSDAFTIAKLIPLLVFAGAGLFFIEPANYSSAITPDYSAFSTAVLLLVFAFSGFETPVIAAGETVDPRKDAPFAMLTSIGFVVVLYIWIQIVCIGTLPGLADSQRPLSEAGSRFLGPAGATFITVGVLVSVSGTLNSIMLASPRLLLAMAEQRQIPSFFSITHARFHTPYVAIVLSSGIMLALTLSGTFLSALTISTITRLLTYAAACAALPALRRKSDTPEAAFTAPGGVAVAAAGLGLCAWLLSNSAWNEVRAVGIAVLIGASLYLGFGRRRTNSAGV